MNIYNKEEQKNLSKIPQSEEDVKQQHDFFKELYKASGYVSFDDAIEAYKQSCGAFRNGNCRDIHDGKLYKCGDVSCIALDKFIERINS